MLNQQALTPVQLSCTLRVCAASARATDTADITPGGRAESQGHLHRRRESNREKEEGNRKAASGTGLIDWGGGGLKGGRHLWLLEFWQRIRRNAAPAPCWRHWPCPCASDSTPPARHAWGMLQGLQTEEEAEGGVGGVKQYGQPDRVCESAVLYTCCCGQGGLGRERSRGEA